MSKQKLKCKKTESLLLKQAVEGLSAGKENKLKAHLDSCPSCRQFASGLREINEAFISSEEKTIKPRPETLMRLKEKMSTAGSASRKRNIFRFISEKSHIYPAVAAVIVAIMLVFSVNTVVPVSEVTPIDTTYNQIIIMTQPAVVDYKTISQQAGGKSIREDSLLLNYIYSGM